MTISLCMIVRNEEQVLARCLESVKDLVDEIILVDTGSTDATKQIAARYTQKIFDFVWEDDFAAARNFAFSQATQEYLFWMDADDVILPEHQVIFREMKETLESDVDVVMLPYHVAQNADGTPAFWYMRERLLRRQAGFVWEGAVHEVIVPTGKIVEAQAAITHKKERCTDTDRNLHIYQSLLEKGHQFSAREQYYYARELHTHALWKKAAEAFENFLERPDGWIPDIIQAILLLADCFRKMDCTCKVQSTLVRGLQVGIPTPPLCCALAETFFEKQDWQAAIFWYEAACHVPEYAHGFQQPAYHTWIPYLQLCVCYAKIGELPIAYQWHCLAKKAVPEHPSVIYNTQYFAENFNLEQDAVC